MLRGVFGMQVTLILLPLLTSAVGYYVGDVSKAVSGFVIALGPLLCVWLFSGDEASTATVHPEEVLEAPQSEIPDKVALIPPSPTISGG